MIPLTHDSTLYSTLRPAALGSPAPVDYLGLLWRRKGLTTTILLLSLAVSGLYWLFAPRWYVATARLLVERQGALTDPPPEQPSPANFLATQSEIIRSPAVVEQALKSVALPFAFDPQLDPFLQILKDLNVRPLSGTSVININYTARDEKFAVRFTQSLIDSYRQYLAKSQKDFQAESLQLVKEYESSVRRDLDQLNRKYAELAKKRPDPEQARDVGELRRSELTQLGGALITTRLRRLELENSLEATRRTASAANERPLLSGKPTVERASAQANSEYSRVAEGLAAEITNLQQRLAQLQLYEKETERLVLPNDRRVREAREAVDTVRKLLEEKQQEAMDYELAGRKSRELQHNELLQQQRRQELASLRAQEEQLAELYRKAQERGHTLHGRELAEQQILASIQQLQQVHDSVSSRSRQLQMMDQSLNKGRLAVGVRVLENPTSATPKMIPPPLLFLLLSVIVGLATATGVASLYERAGTKVVSEEQVESRLALPVLANIPSIRTARRRENASLMRGREVVQWPQCAAADAFRTLRTRLLYDSPHDEGLVIQLASAVSGEGKTTVAANLACSFAQLDKQVILVDADIRLGVGHRIFEVDASRGLSTLLQGETSLDESISRSHLAPVDVLTAGPQVENPTELLAHHRFDTVLAQLRSSYDVVIIDGPPILMDAGALVLAAKVDALLLCLRVGHSTVGEAVRVRELLAGVKRYPLGIVLSEVPIERRYLDRYGVSNNQQPLREQAALSRPSIPVATRSGECPARLNELPT